MTTYYQYGHPLQTEAIVTQVALTAHVDPKAYIATQKAIPGPAELTVSFSEQDQYLSDGQAGDCYLPTPVSFLCTLALGQDDIVYGLGEQNRGINKRGYIYTSYNADDPNHTENKQSLYASHNFLVIDRGTEAIGLFFDTPGKITFDIGYTRQDTLCINAAYADLNLYCIRERDTYTVCRSFRSLIGHSYIPPFWAFGYQQSRWGYRCEADVRAVVDGYRDAGIPLDAVCLDIDYMVRYKDFSIDDAKFPHFAAFVKEMKQQGIRLIPIIDAGIRIEDGYPVYEEGVRCGYFCRKADGSNFVAGVWPGRTHFPDTLNDEAAAWFGDQYKMLTELGIEGVWNDMNEPAIFYSDETLKETFTALQSYKDVNLDATSFFQLVSLMNTICNNEADHRRFYHRLSQTAPDGSRTTLKVRHDLVHNLYGYGMTRAAANGFAHLCNKRTLLYSRASYIGMHRYGGVWMGDNCSWWSHILLNLKMLPSLGMCGFLYTGADLGGFGTDTTRDLLLRWLALGVFTPLMRNHAAHNTRLQEAFRFEHPEDFASVLQLRYALLPYLYSEFVRCAQTDDLLFRPLAFDYPQDAHARHVEDQLMLGDGLMICPVYTQNATGRYVYLPEEMLCIRYAGYDNVEYSLLTAGHHFITVALNEVVFFLRKDHLLVLCTPADNTAALDKTELELIGVIENGASYDLYEDDGFCTEIDLSAGSTHLTAMFAPEDEEVTLTASKEDHHYNTIFLTSERTAL